VKVVTEVVRTGCATVAVEYTEEADLRPLDVEVLLALRLQDVEDDGDTIFVVVSDYALVCVGCVRFN